MKLLKGAALALSIFQDSRCFTYYNLRVNWSNFPHGNIQQKL